MKQLFVMILLICAAASFALGQSKAKADDDFNGFIKRYYEAWNTLNPDNVSQFYAKDADLVFFDITPLKYTSWTQYHDTFKNTVAPEFKSIKLMPGNDLKVTRRGNIAWGTLTFHISAVQKDGTALEFDARHTLILERRGRQWLIVHEHISKPL